MSSQVRGLASIIIVNYNGVQLLAECLKSVFAQEYRPVEVIVVDNASTDDSVEMVKRSFPDSKLVVNAANLGFAEANNQGCEAASGEFIVLLNNDTVVDRLWLVELLELLEHEGVAVAASRVVTDNIPHEFYEMNGSINYLGYNVMRQFADLSQIFYAGGTSLAFRKKNVGVPFLKEYFLYQEDVYLSWRLRLQGWDVRMEQGSLVSHRGSVSTKTLSSARVTFYQERNRALNSLLLYEGRTLLRLLPFFIGDAVAKIMLSLTGKGKSFVGIIRGYWWLLMNCGWIRRERRKHQAMRRVPDDEIMSLMSSDVVDAARSNRGARAVNRVARSYAKLVGLKHLGSGQ